MIEVTRIQGLERIVFIKIRCGHQEIMSDLILAFEDATS